MNLRLDNKSKLLASSQPRCSNNNFSMQKRSFKVWSYMLESFIFHQNHYTWPSQPFKNLRVLWEGLWDKEPESLINPLFLFPGHKITSHLPASFEIQCGHGTTCQLKWAEIRNVVCLFEKNVMTVVIQLFIQMNHPWTYRQLSLEIYTGVSIKMNFHPSIPERPK